MQKGYFETRSARKPRFLPGRFSSAGSALIRQGALSHGCSHRGSGEAIPYVGRGGLKLAGALDAFHLDPAGRIVIDVGASTGGFTDVLLQRGAARVFAIDVGYGQLAWKLRSDPRVTVLDRTKSSATAPDALPRPRTSR